MSQVVGSFSLRGAAAQAEASRIRLANCIEGITFDAVLKLDHTSNLFITEHPVEDGSNITDHSRVEPDELVIEVGVSDSGTYWRAGEVGRSVLVHQQLRALQRSRQPFNVTTRLGTYKNMLIASLSVPEDYTTMHAYKATITLKEIPMVSTSTVTVAGRSADAHKTTSTNNGTKQATSTSSASAAANQSVLASIGNKARSLL